MAKRSRKTLERGDKGDEVRAWQEFLISLGYDLGKSGKGKSGVDGDFGRLTEAATKDFQRRSGIGDSGIVDWRTRAEYTRARGLIPTPRMKPDVVPLTQTVESGADAGAETSGSMVTAEEFAEFSPAMRANALRNPNVARKLREMQMRRRVSELGGAVDRRIEEGVASTRGANSPLAARGSYSVDDEERLQTGRALEAGLGKKVKREQARRVNAGEDLSTANSPLAARGTGEPELTTESERAPLQRALDEKARGARLDLLRWQLEERAGNERRNYDIHGMIQRYRDKYDPRPGAK